MSSASTSGEGRLSRSAKDFSFIYHLNNTIENGGIIKAFDRMLDSNETLRAEYEKETLLYQRVDLTQEFADIATDNITEKDVV